MGSAPHRLALLDADVDGRGDDLLGGALVRDDLQQRHLVDRREVVHAHDVLGPRGLVGVRGRV